MTIVLLLLLCCTVFVGWRALRWGKAASGADTLLPSWAELTGGYAPPVRV